MLSARARWALLLTGAMVLPLPAVVSGQAADLPMGAPASGRASSDQPAVYTFSTDAAGFLTVVVRATADTDLVLVLADAMGQPLPEGRSDQDLQGDTGAEQAVFTIPRPGDYRVRVETWGSGGEFRIMAGWIPFADVAQAPDPDGSPDSAASLTPGSPVQDSIDPAAGDAWDWFRVSVDDGGIITVVTEGDGDLALEVFAEGTFAEAMERSDQDLQGSSGNESLTVRAEPGQTFYFRVSPVFSSSGTVSYTIRAGVM